jgi:hypothetical protein
MNTGGVSGQGLLMIVVGAFLILRTVTKDSSGRTLIDHILGTKSSSQTAGDTLAALLVADVTAKTISSKLPSGSGGSAATGSEGEDEDPNEGSAEIPPSGAAAIDGGAVGGE